MTTPTNINLIRFEADRLVAKAEQLSVNLRITEPMSMARARQAQLGAINVSHAVRRWLDTEGNNLEAFQPRDLRRTWKSRTHDAGIDRFTRDLIQQHAKQDTGSKSYDRADYFAQMREAMTKWNAYLETVLSGQWVDPDRQAQ